MPPSPPERVAGVPVPPEWLEGHALDCWNRVGNLLAKRGQLSEDSTPSLTALCVTWAQWVELAQDLQKKGRTQRVRIRGAKAGERGTTMERQRPQVAAFADVDRRLKGWLIEFGLTDASRGKVSTAPPTNPDDALARYGLQ